MKNPSIVLRRVARILLTVIAGLMAFYCLVLGYGMCIERKWLAVKTLNPGPSPCLKIVHITDIHYKGDRKYLTKVVDVVNRLSPDIVCITGDIVEESGFMDEALAILCQIQCPLFGIPGNHDINRTALCESRHRHILSRHPPVLPA